MLFNCLLIVFGYHPTAVYVAYAQFTYELIAHPMNFYTDNFSPTIDQCCIWKLYYGGDCILGMGLLLVVGIGLPGLHFCIITSVRVFPNQPCMLTFLRLAMFISLRFFLSFIFVRIPSSAQQTSYLWVRTHVRIFVTSLYPLPTPA